jgi:phosphomethylpyrimidine synthase
MRITQEVREFARLQNQPSDSFVAAEDAEAGMAEMSKVYEETGRELYMGVDDREHD